MAIKDTRRVCIQLSWLEERDSTLDGALVFEFFTI